MNAEVNFVRPLILALLLALAMACSVAVSGRVAVGDPQAESPCPQGTRGRP